MITKFQKYNEGIKSLLVGPTKEEVRINLEKKLKRKDIFLTEFLSTCKDFGVKFEYDEFLRLLKYDDDIPSNINNNKND